MDAESPVPPAHCCCLVQGLWDALRDCVLSQGSVPVWQGGFYSWRGDSKALCPLVALPLILSPPVLHVFSKHIKIWAKALHQATEVLIFLGISPPTSPVLSLPSHSLL